jgi:CBS domain-containing protein
MLIVDVLNHKGSEVTTVTQTTRVAEVVRILAERRIGAVVVEDRLARLAGIFSERDLVNALVARGAAVLDWEVQELMTRSVVTCAPADRIDAVLAKMTLNRFRHMPVLRDGRLGGIVSIGDLVKHRLEEKELEAGVLLDITRRHA